MAAGGLRQITPRERLLINEFSARHGSVRSFAQPISDDDGTISSPLLRLGMLARLEQRGRITPAMREAGDRFNALFQRGGLDGLKAADMARVPVAGGTAAGDLSASHERCRRRVAEALAALGGNGSIAASIVWHCVGEEMSVNRWALTLRRDRSEACGILIGALAALAAHFASGRPARRA